MNIISSFIRISNRIISNCYYSLGVPSVPRSKIPPPLNEGSLNTQECIDRVKNSSDTSSTSSASEDVFTNPNYVFHGIGYDLGKLFSILEHGILSAKQARNQNVCMTYTYGNADSGPFFNGMDHISFCRSPVYPTKRNEHQAFFAYATSGISFVVELENDLAVSEEEPKPFFSDECFIKDKVALSSIVAITVPIHAWNQPLEDLLFLDPETGWNTLPNRSKKLCEFIENVTQYKKEAEIEDLLNGKKELENKEERAEFAKKISSYIARALSSRGYTTLGDVLQEMIQPTGIPIIGSAIGS
jgi:hypothetical protein